MRARGRIVRPLGAAINARMHKRDEEGEVDAGRSGPNDGGAWPACWSQEWLGEEEARRQCSITTRENPSSSAGFRPISSAGRCATDKALQLTYSSSVPPPALLLNRLSSSVFLEVRYW